MNMTNHIKWAFAILNLDEKKGSPITADDLSPFDEARLDQRDKILKKSIRDPAVAAIYAQVPMLERLVGIPLEVDHIVPLHPVHGMPAGKHVASNLQIVPVPVNRRKTNQPLGKYTDYL